MDLLSAFRDANPRFFEEEFLDYYCGARVGTQLLTGLRASNRAWHAAIPAPARCSVSALLRNAAKSGNMEMCLFILSRIPEGERSSTTMLIGAAEGGHLQLCEFASKHGLGRSVGIMVTYGALNGHAHICQRGYEWAVEDGVKFYSYDMIGNGANGGHLHICQQAIKLDPKASIPLMVYGAAAGGHRELFEIALGMLGDDTLGFAWDQCAYDAARAGNASLCEFILEKSGKSLSLEFLKGGTSGGHIEICKRACEWFGLDDAEYPDLYKAFTSCMTTAICSGRVDILTFLHDWAREHDDYVFDWKEILYLRNICKNMTAFRVACEWMVEDREYVCNWGQLIEWVARVGDEAAIRVLLEFKDSRGPQPYRAPW